MSAIVTNEIQDSVSSLYIAFFGRAPDARGFGYWTEEMAGGVSPFAIAANFARSDEWISNYGGLTPTQQVTLFYNNVFDRDPDQDGLDYWVGEIEDGTPVSEVAYQIIWAAYLGGEGVDPADNAIVLNKIAVAEYFAIDLKSNDTDIAATAFDGVTQDEATVIAAEERLYAEVNPTPTYTLTTGADNDVALASSATFNGQVNANGQLTWQTWDTISGGSGTDTLNADMNGNVVTMTNVSSIENLNLNVFNAAATVNAASLASIQSITVNDTAGLTINSLGSLPSVSLSGTGATAIQFTAAALTPSAQTLNVTLAGKTAGALTISDVGTAVLETVAISSTGGANTLGGLTTSGIGSTTLNISGDQNLTLGAITDTNATLRTVDASAATGNVSVIVLASSTFTGGSGNDTVTSSGGVDNLTGGAGNDTFAMAGFLTAIDTIAGGDGTADVISATAATLTAFTAAAPTTNISGVESLTLNDALGGGTLLLSAIQAGINDVNLGTVAAAAQHGTVTFDSGVAGNIDVGAAAVASTLGALTVTAAGTGTADSVTIDNDTANIDVFANGAGVITATGVETLTLDGTSTAVAVNQIPGAITMTASTGGTTTVNFIGNNNFAPAGVITAGTINASALAVNLAGVQSALTMIAGANTATTIIGSAGADTLHDNNGATTATSIDGGAGNDTITSTGVQNDTLRGGTGADTITGAQGNDNIDGGEGNDTILVLTDDITANDTISGGDGIDTLSYTTYTAATANVVASQTRVSDFEVLAVAGTTAANQASTLTNYLNNTGFTTIRLGTVANAANGVDFANASSSLNTIQVSVTAAADSVGTNSFDRLVDTAADSLTISNASVVNGAGAAATLTALSALDEETISISGTNAANDLTIATLTVADLTTLNISGAADVIITQLAGDANLATVDASTATGAVTVSAESAGRAVTMTGNSNSTAVNTLTGGVFADSITGSGGADVLVGGGGADTILGGAGADAITGGTGADLMNGGTGIDTFTTGTAGASVASTLATFAGAVVAAGDTLAFGNGVDVITGFGSTDLLAGGQANTVTTALISGALLAANYVAYGTYSNGVFTAAAAFDATSAKDALVAFGVANGVPTGVNFTGYVVLDDLTAALAAANFV